MGVKERQERERLRMKHAILDAARSLFVSEGFASVSVRKIAESIEYSHAALYGYFANKDEVFLTLAEEGYRMLAADMLVPHTAEPLADVRESYWRYYEFSKKHPEYFALMFLERTIPAARDTTLLTFVSDITEHNTRALQRCVEAGLLPASTDVETARQVLWASTHGPAVIGLTWPRASPLQPDILAANALEAALAGLQAGAKLDVAEPGGARAAGV